jgi:hypothetical protein
MLSNPERPSRKRIPLHDSKTQPLSRSICGRRPNRTPTNSWQIQHFAERSGLPKRLREHATSDTQGARLLRVALAAGGDFTLTRLWVGTRKLERQLKNRKAVPRLLCPACPTQPRRRLGLPDVPTLLGGDG